ncbi:TonB-dependent receptor domain-containing protein [Xanthobacteraceae bacterium A53D]
MRGVKTSLAATTAGTSRTANYLNGVAICALCLAATLAAPQARAQTQPQAAAAVRTFNIPAQPLSSALAQFGRQSGMQVSFPSQSARGVNSSAVSGSLSPRQALDQLLRGTGIGYRITPQGVAVVGSLQLGAGADPGMGADGAMLLDTIEVAAGGGVPNADTPYELPGSVSHISEAQLDRLPPNSPGDVFINTPGVLNSGNRVSSSINPNIRGLQGMGRVNTTVDGALNATTSYRGYAGTRDETYVDPDLIGGIDISKGPAEGVGGGAIGGNINFRTLSAEDIVKDGRNWGVRVKGGLGSNTAMPLITQLSNTAPPTKRDEAGPNGFNGDSWSGSVAAATLQENFEGVIAFSKRKQGNYFAGSNNVDQGFIFPEGAMGLNPGRNAIVRPGGEVYNTSEDVTSFLTKGKLKWGDGHSFELGYMLYDNEGGEEDEALINVLTSYGQRQLSSTRLNSYTAKYRYDPSDNPLVNVRANLWRTDLDHKRGQAYPAGFRDHSVSTSGGDISNTSLFDTAWGALGVNVGTEFRYEDAFAPDQIAAVQEARGPNGSRMLVSAFGRATLEPTDWLELSAGLRFDRYTAGGVGASAQYPDSDGARLSPNATVVVKPWDGVQLYAEYKEGYRPPSLRELYWELYTLQVNPDLEGEVSKNLEFGVNFLRNDVFLTGDKARFKAAYFRNRYDGYIVMDDVPDQPGYQQFTNIDQANYQGFELSGSYDTGWFFVEGNFTKYLKVEYCTATGCEVPTLDAVLANVTPPTFVPPEWSGAVTGGFRMFDQALTIGGRAYFASTRYGTEWLPENTSLPGLIGINFTWPQFVVFDLFATYKFSEDTVLSFSAENLTDQYYYDPLSTTGMPSPGRTLRLGFTHTFGGDNLPRIPAFTLGNAAKGAPGSDWTGVYVGGHLGQASSSVNGVVNTAMGAPTVESPAVDFDGRGVTYGAQLGYNYQFNNGIVLGVEGDFSVLNHQGDTFRVLASETAALVAAGALESESQYQLDWMTTLRARLGYSFGRMMVYGTGGAAFLQQTGSRTQYKAAFGAAPTNTDFFFTETDSKISTGWTAGAGFEFAISNNWTLKGEYSYASFDDAAMGLEDARGGVTRTRTASTFCFPGSGDPLCPPGYFGPINLRFPGSSDAKEGRNVLNDIGLHALKVGVNYRF